MIALALLRKYWLAAAVVITIAAAFAWAYHSGYSSGRESVKLLWDKQIADQIKAASDEQAKVMAEMQSSRAETEQIRAVLADYKRGKERETADLELAVRDGVKRLSVRATCSAGNVPATGAAAGGTSPGTAILDADAGQDYYAYRRAYDAQFADLVMCRKELIKRSSKEK